MNENNSNDSEQESMANIRHSLSHILAEAVLRIFPDAKLAIGPVIENGFYYDFDLPRPLTEEDLETIETEMREILKKPFVFKQETVDYEEAKNISANQPYKLELIEEFKEAGEDITYVRSGEFLDLCEGGHVQDTSEIPMNGWKLSHFSGAYWRGDEKNAMLQRIYGWAFASKDELKAFLHQRDEAKKRDHRKLGKELGLFMIDAEEVGQGLPIWLPKGEAMRQEMEAYLRQMYRMNGYDLVRTPHIGLVKLWETSGHWSFYREDMYSPIQVEDEQYVLKPMNCPFHIKIFQNDQHSYRDLPLRLAEFGTVYRYERSGTMHGLLRVRGFTQDDAHIFVTEEQFANEIDTILELMAKILKDFGFEDYKAYLSVRGEHDSSKYVGDQADWDFSEDVLEKALKRNNIPYQRDEGEAKFYGPAIDVKVRDAIGREWQLSTIQRDFNLAERFNVKYVDGDGMEKAPVILHRAMFGSLERFIATVIEHYAGAFPLWFAPTQVKIVSVGEDFNEFAHSLAKDFEGDGIRTEVDDSDNTVSYKIRSAEKMKVPYILVVGEREMNGEDLTIRKRGEKDQAKLAKEEFITQLHDEIGERVIF